MAHPPGLVEGELTKESQAYLLVGGSGTGKSTFLRRLALANARKPLFLVGGNETDFPGVDCRPHALDSDLLNVKNALVVLDDLFSIRKEKDSEIVRQLLCKTKRHNKVIVGVSVHMLEFTGMRGALFDHFDVIVFTKPKQEEDHNVALFLKRLGKVDWICQDAFSGIPEFGHLWVNVKRQTARLLDSRGRWSDGVDVTSDCTRIGGEAFDEAMAKRRDILKREMGKIFRVFPDIHTLAVCHLDYILKNLSADLVSTSDFTLSLHPQDQGGRHRVKVSLLDFIVCCQRPGLQPTKDQKRLKKYLDTKFVTPHALVPNAKLR